MAKKKGLKRDDDVSRKTIAVLLVIAVLISVIGTWLVLTQEPTTQLEKRSGSSYVRFEIKEEPEQHPIGGAVVGFTII
ncbi:hypothetical protein KY330_03435 [Candidatus Woesearchaeota archaeon]|nr:hypothetical protein [Candidatus Woesearchaeota archaeon]